MDNLTAADFSKHLNTNFKVFRADDEIFEAKLVEIEELRNDHFIYSFAVEFLFPRDFGLEQRIYKLEHPEMEPMELFMVPVWQTDTEVRFEAIFNRIVKK